MPPTRPRLTPAIADVRRAVRASLPHERKTPHEGKADTESQVSEDARPSRNQSPSFGIGAGGIAPGGIGGRNGGALILVALSGGPDSLALAAATAFEAPRLGMRAGAVIVDHGLQDGSADVAAHAAAQATGLGLDPVIVRRVSVGVEGGPEAAARTARYEALATVADETGATAVLLGHTLDDQAETVLLGLARGSGATSLHGMSRQSGRYLRPLLGLRRTTTVQACADAKLEPWLDPQNDDGAFSRVRVRQRVLLVMEQELGPGIPEALVRTAEQLREDAEALDHFAEELAEDLAEHSEAGISLPAAALAANPAALRQRLIRLAVASEFHVTLSRVQTLEIARLVTDWHGQAAIDLPGVRVERRGALILFAARQ